MAVDLPGNAIVGLTRDALVALRHALFRDAGTNATSYLYEAGYAGGRALFEAFTRWSSAHGISAPESMAQAEFEQRAAEFLSELGWGHLAVGTLRDSVITLDSVDWAEADPASLMQYPGCYLSSGLFTDFFGRLAGTSLSVMEVECRSMGGERCRFLLGSAETIQHVYDGIVQGVSYEASLAGMT